jgi:hypothetical protein
MLLSVLLQASLMSLAFLLLPISLPSAIDSVMIIGIVNLFLQSYIVKGLRLPPTVSQVHFVFHELNDRRQPTGRRDEMVVSVMAEQGAAPQQFSGGLAGLPASGGGLSDPTTNYLLRKLDDEAAEAKKRAEALQEQLIRSIQPDHDPLAHHTPVFRLQHHPATGSHHQGMPVGDAGEHLGFELSEPRLTVVGEQVRDRPSGHLFDGLVGVGKRQLQSSGQLTADGRFSGSWKAYEGKHVCICSIESKARWWHINKKGGRCRPPEGFYGGVCGAWLREWCNFPWIPPQQVMLQ